MSRNRAKDALTNMALKLVPIVPGNELKALIDALIRPDSQVDIQVEEAIKSLKATSDLVGALERGLQARTAQLEKLKAEHQKLSALAEITQEQATPIAAMVKGIIERETRRERIVAAGMHVAAGVVFLVLGIFLADPAKDLTTYVAHRLTQAHQ